jgi:hypothetical protein
LFFILDGGDAIYFCLHRSSLPENSARRQLQFGGKIGPRKVRKKLYVSQNHDPQKSDKHVHLIYSNPRNHLIPSAVLSFTIFLNASAIFAGQWTEVPGAKLNNSTLSGVAVVSAKDVWAVGGKGSGALIEHWDGTNWSVAAVQPPGTLLNGVAALSSTDVWAVGQNVVARSLVEHWNGQRWGYGS